MSDADKIITLITEDIGKVSVSARGEEQPLFLWNAGTDLRPIHIVQGRSNYILNGCDILASFYDLANDLERFTYAAHMIEIASDASSDDQTTARVLNLLLHGLNALNKGREPLLVSSAFTMKLMQICGYPPHVTSCVSCHEKDLESIYFVSAGAALSAKCARANKDAVPVTIGTAKAILHVLCSDNPGVLVLTFHREIWSRSPILLTAILRRDLIKVREIGLSEEDQSGIILFGEMIHEETPVQFRRGYV